MILRIGDETDGLAVDTSAGGRISSLKIGGRERMLSQPAEGIEPSIAWGCYLMAPFVGRVKDGLVTWRERTAQLPRNHGRHAIHGAVFDKEWQVTEQTAGSIAMACRFDPARWPFMGSATQSLQIEPGRVTLRAEILAEEPMPAALGWHPWFLDPEGLARVELPSGATLETGPDLIPTGGTLPLDDRTRLLESSPMRARKLDDVYAEVSPPIRLIWPDLELTMDVEGPLRTWVVFNHPQAVCVEPMTAWPDAVRLSAAGHAGTGLVELAAGERLTAVTIWSWRPGR